MGWRKALLVVLALALGLGGLAQTPTLRFSLGEWEPYVGSGLTGGGMATELVSAACAAAGIRPEYAFFPWRRAEDNVLVGSAFGTFPYTDIPERSANYYFSDIVFSSSFALVSMRSSPRVAGFRYSSVVDLQGLRVGITVGTDAILLPLRKAGIEVEESQSPEQNIRKLQLGRIDVFIDDRAVMYTALVAASGGKGVEAFRVEERDFGERNDFRIMVSRRYPGALAILAKINAGLKVIRKSGEYERILHRYGL